MMSSIVTGMNELIIFAHLKIVKILSKDYSCVAKPHRGHHGHIRQLSLLDFVIHIGNNVVLMKRINEIIRLTIFLALILVGTGYAYSPPEDLTENSVLLGSSAHIIDVLQKVHAAGFDEVILYFNVGLKPHAEVKDEMARFMEQVAPHFP